MMRKRHDCRREIIDDFDDEYTFTESAAVPSRVEPGWCIIIPGGGPPPASGCPTAAAAPDDGIIIPGIGASSSGRATPAPKGIPRRRRPPPLVMV